MNQLVRFYLNKDKSIVAEGDKIRFDFSVSGGLPPAPYRDYYFLINGFSEADIEAITFPKAPNGYYLYPDGTSGEWNPTSRIFRLSLVNGEFGKSFDITFKKDSLDEIVDGGHISMAANTRWGYDFEYKYSDNGGVASLDPSGISVLDDLAPKALVELSSASSNEGEGIGSTLIYSGVGQKVYWRVQGLDVNDLWTHPDSPMSGISGEALVNYEGRVRLSHWIKNDFKTEGEESFKIQYSLTDSFSVILSESIAIPIADTSTTPAPTYSLTPSVTSINEGSNLTTSIATTNVASGTTLYYALSGTGISAADFSSDALTGQVTTGTNGTASFSHTLASDLTTEGPETLQIKLFSDSARTIQVGDTATVTISDTSTTPAPTYSLTPSSASINEGGTLTTSIATTNVAYGTTLYYALSGTGITAADFSSDALTGQVTTGTNGSATFSHTLANDLTTEGTETLQIKLFSDSARTIQVGSTASVTISDTSTTPAPTYSLTPSVSSINEGSTLTTSIATTNVATGTTLYYALSGTGINAADFSAGALTGQLSVDTNGTASFSLTLASDLTTEGPETLQIKLFSDSARTIQVGSTALVAVKDISLAQTTRQIWTKLIGTASDDYGVSIATDKNKGVYIYGQSFGSWDEKPGYQARAFTAKYSDNGDLIWLNFQDLTGADYYSDSLSADSEANIYAVGHAIKYATQVGGESTSTAFISKYTDSGQREWTLNIGSSSQEYPKSISASDDGSIYVTGFTQANRSEQNVTGNSDAFIAKYNDKGAREWLKYFGTSNYNDGGCCIKTDSQGFVYIAGELGASYGKDSVITKYSADGTQVWLKRIEGNSYDSAYGLATDSKGDIYLITGQVGDLFLGKYSKDSSLIWKKQLKGFSEANAIRVDDNDAIYISGRQGQDGAIAKLTGEGILLDTRLISTSNDDYASSLAITWDGGICVTGGTWGNLDREINSGRMDAFISKLYTNSIPKGTPTLSGTTKVGQVITIDKTPIQDADNFTGYTPDFKYSWEVSSNGTTWTPITTTDATDNNSTYTLTTAEVGKQVRGVVSYLDGFGTQESVASAASAPITSSAPPVQSLTLTAPGRTTLRSGVSTTSSIAYNVSTGDTALTGIGASLYFDSSQLAVTTAGDPFQKGLIGNAITADTNNVDGDPKTDKVLALTYADFGGQFPGAGTSLPLTIAILNLVPTASYTGTTLHLKGSPATGFTATGADLTLAYNAAPVLNGSIPALSTNRGKAFSYTVPSTLFSDADSTLTLSASSSTGAALPSWLSFNAATRTLSGTPTSGGTLNLNINAADELGSVSAPLTLKVREVQSLSSSTAPLRYQRNKDLTVPINYSTSDASSSTGLAFKVHFNSSLFSFDPSTGVSNKAQADLFQVGAVQLDTTDSDNDPTTDRFIPISIASFSGQFPSGSSPTKLADLTFRSADKAIDPLTGLRDTSINFSETSVASGYGFSGTSATLKPLSFSLDVDGDGLVTPLGDGLMVIRYLFGAAFAGDALINKAISPDSPLLGGVAYSSMTSQQKADVAAKVAVNIQQGVDSKLLDVDKDGQITPLGDGLMVIRRLFGAAFDGAALTSKAISPDSPYFNTANAASIVAANIDALKPTTTTTPVI